MTLHLLTSLSEYDHSRGSLATFIESVLNNKIRAMIRAKRISDDCYRRLAGPSLDETVVGSLDVLGDTLSRDLLESSRGSLTEAEQSDLRIDLGRALDTLTPEMRRLCFRLTEDSISDVARKDGVPRHQVVWMRLRIRHILIGLHIDEYL